MWDRVAEEWNKITPEDCQNLIESLPRRLEAVYKAKGGHTVLGDSDGVFLLDSPQDTDAKPLQHLHISS